MVNETEEEAIFMDRTHPSMIRINTIAYILELVYYSFALVFVPAYIVLSQFARRFHPLLRIQLRLFLIEVMLFVVARWIGVILRLVEGASIPLPRGLGIFRDILTVLTLTCVNDVDMTVFLIAMERLVATLRVNTYEKEYHDPIYRVLLCIYMLVPPNIVAVLAFLLVDTKNPDPKTVDALSIWNYVTTGTYVIGLLAMELSRHVSQKQLNSQDRKLSTSFQCNENIMVVRMFRPIFIILFITRMVQFFTKYYMFFVQYSQGAVAIRIVTHLYNQSVGICFVLVPVILLKFHNNLTRFTRQSAVINRVDGDIYFQSLMQKWQTQ